MTPASQQPTPRRGRLTAEECARIAALADKPLTCGQIALRLNRHPATVYQNMVSHGLRAPNLRSFDYIRNGRRVRSFSRDEDAFIEALRCQNYKCREIADLCGKRFGHPRSTATIAIRLRMLASLETGT